jgi:HSP20 family protein
MDIFDDPSSEMIIAHVEIPGMRKEDVTLQVHESVLVVAGERKPAVGGELLPTSSTTANHRPASSAAAPGGGATPSHAPQSRFRVQELKYGKFKRIIDIPVGLDVSVYRTLFPDAVVTFMLGE